MSSERSNYYERPPLGEAPDFAKIDKENAEKLLSIEYIPVEKYPEIIRAFSDINKGMNEFRKKFNAPEMDFDASCVRFLEKDSWEKAIEIAGVEEDNGAFWDQTSGKCYINFDKEKYERSRSERIIKIYTICHELGHKALSLLDMQSPVLSEALADSAAIETMESHVLPKIYTPEEYSERKRYIEELSPDVEGFKVKKEELFTVAEGKIIHATGCARIPEMRLMEKMTSAHPDEFKKMIETYLGGDTDKFNELLRETYGEEAADRLSERNADIKEIMEMIK